jgi:hypothetical protein
VTEELVGAVDEVNDQSRLMKEVILRLQRRWVGRDSNPQPTPKAFGAAPLVS